MDRIDPLTGAPIPFHRQEKKRVEKKKSTARVFGSLVEESRQGGLDEISPELSASSLEEMLDEIHQAGETLAEDPGMSNVMAYKRIVQAFLRYVVKNSRQVDHQEGARLTIFKPPKRYTLITVIDRKLEQLAAGILQNQAEKLEILQKVEEIQGLLVDLTG